MTVRIEPGSRRAFLGGEELRLTSVEYDLLECLSRKAGRVVSRQELMGLLGRAEVSPLDRALDVHISHLRKKLGRHRRTLITVRGSGYMMAEDMG